MKNLYLGKRMESNEDAGFYELGTNKRDWDKRCGFNKSCITTFCPNEFELLTNVKLKPGELRKVEKITFKFAKGK